jgi:hypothetical protein
MLSALPLHRSFEAHVIGCVQLPAPSHWSTVHVWASAVHAVPNARFVHAAVFTADWQDWHSLLGFRAPFA